MNQHKKIKQLVSVYNDLNSSERRVVDQHLEICHACAAALATYQHMDQSLLNYTEVRTEQATVEADVSLSRNGAIESRSKRVVDVPKSGGLIERLFRPPTLAVRLVGVAVLLLAFILVTSSGLLIPDSNGIVNAATPTVDADAAATSTMIAAAHMGHIPTPATPTMQPSLEPQKIRCTVTPTVQSQTQAAPKAPSRSTAQDPLAPQIVATAGELQ